MSDMLCCVKKVANLEIYFVLLPIKTGFVGFGWRHIMDRVRPSLQS